jgi:histidinol-phosphate aminotransferase
MPDLISRWVRPEIRALRAYHVPDATGLIKLDAMENPYTWPDPLRREWAELLQRVDVNRYPDPTAARLKERLRACFSIPAEAGLLLGNGSDEIIQMLALTLGGPGRVVLSVDPSFVMYRMIATFAGLEYVGVPLCSEDFSLDAEALLAALSRHRPVLVFLAYPNNPTGNLFDTRTLREVIQAAPGLVVIDEAYAPFTEASFLGEVPGHGNLVVMRTLSKMGLAGLRLGYLVGPREWVREVDKTRMPYNINVLTQEGADFALRHKTLLDQQTGRVCAERERLSASLAALPGVQPYPSDANFILFRVAGAPAIWEVLRSRGILIKCLHGADPLLADCLRVTVGTPEENDALLGALTAVLD